MTNDIGPNEQYVHAIEGGETASTAVIHAVATVDDCSPFDIEPLYEHVDPDALDTMVSHRGGGTEPKIKFSFGGYKVAVTPDVVRLRTRRGTSTD